MRVVRLFERSARRIAIVAVLGLEPVVAQCLLDQLQTADPSPGGEFGRSVVINGSQAAIGEVLGLGYDGPGLAHVYDRIDGQWVLAATVEASDNHRQSGGIGPGDGFGHALAIAGDTLLVGAPFHTLKLPQWLSFAGAVYVYERSGSTWVEAAKLLPSMPKQKGLFGYSISMDGDRALIGAGYDGGEGAAYVFRRTEAGWIQEQHLGPGLVPTQNGSFGIAVALEGDTAFVGDWSDGPGRVYHLEHDGATWGLAQILSATSPLNVDSFGFALSLDDDRLLVGAPTTTNGGAAYVFEPVAGEWTQTAELRAALPSNGDDFGGATELRGDLALIGAIGRDFVEGAVPEFIQDAGAAYVFEESGGSWTQELMVSAAEHQAFAYYGQFVALGDGYGLAASPGHAYPGGFGRVESWYFPTATLEADTHVIPITTGGSQSLDLRSLANPGALYFVLGSTASPCPGILVEDSWLPLTFDAYMLFTVLNPNSALLGASLGLLAPDGTATTTFSIPPGITSLAGVILHHAAIVADVSTGGVVAVSNAESVRFGS